MKQWLCLAVLLLLVLLPALGNAAQPGAQALGRENAWRWWTIAVCSSGVAALMTAWGREKLRQQREGEARRTRRRRRRGGRERRRQDEQNR